jgi:hypothetical protein
MQIKTVSTKGNLTEPISGSRIQGGIYIGKYNGKHIIIAEEDVPKELNWHDAMEYCSNLELNGFTNWYLPPKDELNFAYENARQYMNYKSSLQSELNRLNNILKNTKDRT